MPIFFALLTALMVIVIVLDAWKYLIPNWLVGLVVALYPALVFMNPGQVDWVMALAAGAGMFAVGLGLFALRLMGGGDVKMLAALSLWTGLAALMEFVLLVALFGGALTLGLLVLRPLVALGFPKRAEAKTLPRLLTKGAAVPYGLAIAAAFLMLLWQEKLPGLKIAF